MQKKYLFIVMPIIALVVAALACAESTPEVKAPEEEGEQASQTEATSVPVGSSRSNPAPLGSEVTIDEMTFVIADVIRPANDIVAGGNEFNSAPEEGKEFVMVTISATCEKGGEESCLVGPSLDLSLIGSAGVVYDPEWLISGVDNQLESTEFFGGSTVSGSIFFEVQQGETDLLMRYEPFLGLSKAFLALTTPGE